MRIPSKKPRKSRKLEKAENPKHDVDEIERTLMDDCKRLSVPYVKSSADESKQ